jgi:Tol biopolymer transport system component
LALPAGTRFGSYEVTGQIGAGGMGEVYRARDTTLNRDVAIKVLPEAFAQDADRLARFRREAQVLASLNHPNIAAIYAIENRALVMELVEGEDLSQRIARGPFRLDDALPIARQIADALAAAHDAGIIHRDLKPANIKVREDGTVKVLDFGLAKALDTNASSATADTMVSPAQTALGVILGTAAYMAPEQAKGKPVDRRADVWAFGVILHEMLTGERTFAADTVGESISAVLTREPDWSRVPVRARRLLQACLQKEPRKRLRDIGDAQMLLEIVEDTPAPAPRRALVPWVAGALVIGAVAVAAAIWKVPSTAPSVPFVFHEPAPEGTRLIGAPKASPDGQSLAILAITADGQRQIWTRALADERAGPLEGTQGVGVVFWSPDSTELAFTAGDELYRIPRAGGQRKRVAAAGQTKGTTSGVWTPAGEMVVAGPAGMFRVSADGGSPRQLFPDRPGVFVDLALLPSGRHLLFRQLGGETGLHVMDLTSGEIRRLEWDAAATATGGVVSFLAPDVILYVQNQGLVGRRLDLTSLTWAGDSFPIAAGIRGFQGSAGGALAYISGGAVRARLTWRDRTGRSLGAFGPEGDYREVYLSPRGTWLMYTAADPTTGNLDLWIQDPRVPAGNRLTNDPDVDHVAAFSPDDREVVWEGHRGSALTVFRRRSDGADDVRKVRDWNRGGGPTDWSPDGKFVVYQTQEVNTLNDLWVLPMQDDTAPFPLVATEFEDTEGVLSPDGRWLAYRSTATGQAEIYLQRLDGWRRVGGPRRVSSGGGEQPRWRRDGTELFYLTATALMAASISRDADRPAGPSRALFAVARGSGALGRNDYAVSPDGQRFLLIEGGRETAASAVVILHWASRLARR